jgi:hypothetical protein
MTDGQVRTFLEQPAGETQVQAGLNLGLTLFFVHSSLMKR